MAIVLGIDFGTTNSVVASLDTATGRSRTLRFAVGDSVSDVFRSVLCFWQEVGHGRSELRHAAGPAAIEAFLDDPHDTRLVMSPKSYLASPSFTSTNLLGRVHTLERLVGLFLRALLAAAGVEPGSVHVTAGRPVRFAGDSPDDALGERRLRAAFAEAGLPSLEVALEPEAAGYRFTRGLATASTVLIGDFGGGTSDFSVLRFEPGRPIVTLGRAGVGIAGDAFDARIMEHVVAPRLGRGTTYAPGFGREPGNDLPVPPDWYSAFARWHRLSMMRTPRMLADIDDVRRSARHPGRLADLRRLIEDEQGYPLYRAVSDAKAALSVSEATVLRFAHEGFVLDEPLTRAAFESWIATDLVRLDAAVDEALAHAGLAPPQVDRVFLTGGTAFVPAVRALFERRFGRERLSGGGEFVSVAEGLALIGAEQLAAHGACRSIA